MSLELKVPPLLVFVIIAILMWLTSAITPVLYLASTFQYILVSALLFVGIFFAIAGVVSFRYANTTVNPTQPNNASSLVTTGIYRRTRNPMYVGIAFVLLAWSCILLSPFSVVGVPMFIWYMNKYQIKAEEAALIKIFGDEYTHFKSNTKRWL